ncbi:hypothetical protein UFOVP746_21 [uncultured Caudovirales phage]|uniref:Uncharacterized protein n=1 Tax=uncultured Caudovirales phage TaxID=2100421 RepID=A0A6J7X7D4_9CAUD|nr:hypothetical protein UFOVP746_21 [uncultured Caudovirales phage]
MRTGECKYCSAQSGIYEYECNGCRNRMLLDEPCKILRKALAERIQLWGEISDWKTEPHCGCKAECKRMKTMRDNQTHIKEKLNGR